MISPTGILCAIVLVLYAFKSAGLYVLAKRRSVALPLLAWFPIARDYLMGCLADQYQRRIGEPKKSMRWLLPLLSLLNIVCGALFWYGCNSIPGEVLALSLLTFGGMLIGWLYSHLAWIIGWICAALAVGIGYTVVRGIVLNRLYRSCDPSNRVVNVIMSLFVPCAESIILFLCRNKDLGMPPESPEELLESDCDF